MVLRFGGVTALDGVTFDVHAGELFAIIGPNGAGKTSIFNCLNSVYEPTSGSIAFDGVDLKGVSPSGTARLGIGRTFQNLGLFVNLTLVDNLMLGRHHLMRSGFVAGMVWWGRAKHEELAHRARGRADRRAPRAGSLPAFAGRLVALRHPEAHRARSRAGDGAEAAAPR